MTKTADWRAEVRDLCVRRRALERKAERVMPDDQLRAALTRAIDDTTGVLMRQIHEGPDPFGGRLGEEDRREWAEIRASFARIAGEVRAAEGEAEQPRDWRAAFLAAVPGPERKALYREYLRSVEWKHRRERVLVRDGHLCQGCRVNGAAEVHHLTYEHAGAEFLFELVSLCHDCHESLSTTDSGCSLSGSPLHLMADGQPVPKGVLLW